jgi:hypothetical protein
MRYSLARSLPAYERRASERRSLRAPIARRSRRILRHCEPARTGSPRNTPRGTFTTKAMSSPMQARCGRRAATPRIRRRTRIGFDSRAQVAMVAMGDHRTSAAHTMRVKSTSGSTSLHSMAPPSSFGVTIRASALATGWQLLSRQGGPGYRGETGERGVRGEKGDRGEPGATVVSWQLDRERYRVSPLMSDGKVGPMLEFRPMFEQFLAEVAS